MTPRKASWILAAAAGLAIGTGALAQQQPQQREGDRANAQAGGNQADRSDARADASGRNAQGGQQADDAIDHVLMQIAQDPKTAADKLFVLTAALHNQSELELAREVAQKSQNDQVKRMAQRMIQQLQQTQQQLQQTAQAIGLSLPQDLSRAAVQEVRIVAALPADQIDRQYTARAQADNAEDASAYASEAQIGQDPQVRRFAQDQSQSIQQRRHDADQTAQAMGMRGDQEAQPASGTIPGRRNEAGGGNNNR